MSGNMLCTCCSKQNCYIFIWSKVVKQNVKCVHFAACNIDQRKSCPASEKDSYTNFNLVTGLGGHHYDSIEKNLQFTF